MKVIIEVGPKSVSTMMNLRGITSVIRCMAEEGEKTRNTIGILEFYDYTPRMISTTKTAIRRAFGKMPEFCLRSTGRGIIAFSYRN